MGTMGLASVAQLAGPLLTIVVLSFFLPSTAHACVRTRIPDSFKEQYKGNDCPVIVMLTNGNVRLDASQLQDKPAVVVVDRADPLQARVQLIWGRLKTIENFQQRSKPPLVVLWRHLKFEVTEKGDFQAEDGKSAIGSSIPAPSETLYVVAHNGHIPVTPQQKLQISGKVMYLKEVKTQQRIKFVAPPMRVDFIQANYTQNETLEWTDQLQAPTENSSIPLPEDGCGCETSPGQPEHRQLWLYMVLIFVLTFRRKRR